MRVCLHQALWTGHIISRSSLETELPGSLAETFGVRTAVHMVSQTCHFQCSQELQSSPCLWLCCSGRSINRMHVCAMRLTAQS